MKKNLSPLTATTIDDVCELKSDHKSTSEYWIITDGGKVTICKQQRGLPSEEQMSIPVKDFNRLVEWYIKPQK